jgi:hypothetical protein
MRPYKKDFEAIVLSDSKTIPALTDDLDTKTCRMTSRSSREREDPPLIFVSLGPAVIDEIHFSSGKTIENVPGGAGIYGMSLLP